MTKGLIQLFFAMLFFLAAGYCLLWIFSSASLAPAGCYGDFSFFHSEFRCRQPYVAVILSVATAIVSVMLTACGYKNIKRANKKIN